MNDFVYEVMGRYWDVARGCYIDSVPVGVLVVQLYKDGQPAGEDYLVDTLKYYGYPLGQFATNESDGSVETLEERIARLEAELAELKAQAVQFQSNGGISYAV